MICFAGFELDTERARLRGPDGEAIRLRPKSFDMLQLFASNPGRVLSKQDLIEAIWPNVHVGDDSLFQCIREIRTALGDDQRQLIKLVSGRGYLFEADVSEQQNPPKEAGATGGPQPATAVEETAPATAVTPAVTAAPVRKSLRIGLRAALATAAGFVAIIGLAAAAPMLAPDLFARKAPAVAAEQIIGTGEGKKIGELASNVTDRLSAAFSVAATAPVPAADLNLRKPPTVTVMPITGVGESQQTAEMAAAVTEQLTDGLAKIDKLRVLAPRPELASASPQPVVARTEADFVISGELRMEGGTWTLQARMSNGVTGELRWADSISVGIENADTSLQRTRLTAGIGHPLALRINAINNAGPGVSDRELAGGSAKVVIEQATASINQTTPERFKAAQAMLEKAVADNPGNVDLEAALAAHLLRGIQLVWYNPADVPATERDARALLERALRIKPTYIPVLEGYCRFLTTTNQFIESLVACGKVLSVDPWDGLALYNLALSQVQLGRFEDALTTFTLAEQFDTPRVARWTWLLGAGMTSLLMDRDEQAVAWLKKSLAVTPGTGRTHALLAAAYQRLGRIDKAKAAMAKTLELRPGSNAINIVLPKKNASPVFIEAAASIVQAMVDAGLPEK